MPHANPPFFKILGGNGFCLTIGRKGLHRASGFSPHGKEENDPPFLLTPRVYQRFAVIACPSQSPTSCSANKRAQRRNGDTARKCFHQRLVMENRSPKVLLSC